MTGDERSDARAEAHRWAEEQDIDRLASRVRLVAGLVLAGALAFMAADRIYIEGSDLLASFLQLTSAALSVAVIVALRDPQARLRAVPIATLYMAVEVMLVTVIGTIRGDARADTVLFVVIMIGVAALFPWGPLPQFVVCCVVAAGTVYNGLLVDGSLLTPHNVQTLVAVAFGVAVSMAISFELRRARREAAEGRRALELSESESRAREARLRMITSNVPAILGTVDRGLRVTYITGAGLPGLGIDSDEVIGRELSEVLVDDNNPDAIPDAARRALAGESISRETSIGDQAFQLCADPLRDETGTIVGAIGMALNVNDLKRVERELTELNAVLEQRVADRTAEIESFTYAVSHDLRLPLRAVNGFATMIEESLGERLDVTTKEYLDRVRAGMTTMGCMIDDLLQLARVSDRKLSWSRVDLTAMAEELVGALREAAPEREIRVTIARGLEAYGDEGLVRLLLQNLLENSWKFTVQNEVAAIELGCDGEEGEMPVFFVSDDGAGFDMDHASKLFGPFQRLHRPDEFAGTGIGLATVARIVDRHGGRVWGESEKDRGAVFRFTLPAQAPSI